MKIKMQIVNALLGAAIITTTFEVKALQVEADSDFESLAIAALIKDCPEHAYVLNGSISTIKTNTGFELVTTFAGIEAYTVSFDIA